MPECAPGSTPVALAVPLPVEERDDVQAVPDVRADHQAVETELLVELPAQRRLVVLARLLPAARRRPHRDRRELEANQQDTVVGIEEEGADGRPDPQLVGHQTSVVRLVGEPVVERAVQLVDRLARLADRQLLRVP